LPALGRGRRVRVSELDGQLTRTDTLDEINDGDADLREGKNLRGVIVLD
jgi:Zn-dependent alcohol dehydrogenase